MPTSNPSKTCSLAIHCEELGTRIEVLDAEFRPVKLPNNLGDVEIGGLAPGVYVVRFSQGGQSTERLVALTPDNPSQTVSLGSLEAPKFASAAPVKRTSTTREYQRYPAGDFSRSTPIPLPSGTSGGSRLMILLRDPYHKDGPARQLERVTLHNLAGELLGDVTRDGKVDQYDGWSGLHLDLAPGAYRLRRAPFRGMEFEQIVQTAPGWQTQVFMAAAPRDREKLETEAAFAQVSILMSPVGVGFDGDRFDLRWTEAALRAMENRSAIPGRTLSQMFREKFANPMLGIYAALLHLRREEIDPKCLGVVVRNLLELVGPLPDVLAIGHALVRRGGSVPDREWMAVASLPIGPPPMLRESWEHLVRATVHEPALIPADSFAARASASLLSGSVWLRWPAKVPMQGAGDLAAEESRKESPIEIPEILRIFGLRPSHLHTLSRAVLDFAGLRILAAALRKNPHAALEIAAPRIAPLERRLAFLLHPALDPSVAAFLEAAPDEITDPDSEVADADLIVATLKAPATAVLGAAWSLILKLARPTLPTPQNIETFITEESRGQPAYRKLFQGLRRGSGGIAHRDGTHSLNPVELLYLSYRGSPASLTKSDLDDTASRLTELGFVCNGQPIGSEELRKLHAQVQQRAVGILREQVLRGELVFSDEESSPGERLRKVRSGENEPEMTWERAVFPVPSVAERRALLPLLPSEARAAAETAVTGVAPISGRKRKTKADTATGGPTVPPNADPAPRAGGKAGGDPDPPDDAVGADGRTL